MKELSFKKQKKKLQNISAVSIAEEAITLQIGIHFHQYHSQGMHISSLYVYIYINLINAGIDFQYGAEH